LTEPFAPVASYAYAADSGRKGSDSHDPGERTLMAAILIVEDDVFIREVAELMIQDWGHQTLSASDVDEALALLRWPQHIDALFTNICLKTAVLGG
jgi:hypothetical protein